MATVPLKMEWRTAPGSRGIFDVEIPEDEVTRAMDRAYASMVQRVQVPGFRRGKAPRVVLERHIGTAALREEALRRLLPESYAQAVKRSGLSPIGTPSFEVHEIPDGRGLRLTATVDLYPQVTLPDYHSLRVEREAHPVTDADVDRVLEDFRIRHGHLVSSEGEAARRGDYVLLRVISVPKGLDRLQQGKEVLVEVGGGMVPPEVEGALEGIRSGENRAVQVAGFEGPVELVAIDVRRKELPPLDDAFAQMVSDQATLAGLREGIRQRLTQERTEADDRDLRSRVIDALLAQTTIELPESIVEHEVEHMREDLVDRLRARGLSLETYLRSSGKDEAGLRQDLRESAERRVRTRLLLDAVAEHEAPPLSEEEMTAAVEKLAEELQQDVPRTEAWLAEGDRRVGLRENLLRQKALQKLVALATGSPAAGGTIAAPTSDPALETPAESA